ncbi:AraC family transcriptional regulator [Paenibacillus sp. B2(2019)]|uniref:AraC family transcriptional regulator n=1 Tax=Paenibacillus sp. B2(2019) TaxID=2607754 RepID=UPI0011F126B7|nr:AraC family transcriptional regulator [Paenibacillus sp. B2(2019)]KAA1181883.1 AraC family transcriptional regulator [Paenibacillus sp. B2(2019)]
MNISNLFFHILYCNYRYFNEPRRNSSKIVRTLQHHELLLVTGGKSSFMIDRKRHLFKAGMLFYICPDVKHSIEIDAEDPLCFLSVHFNYAKVSMNEGDWGINGKVETLHLQAITELKDYYQVEDIFGRMIQSWNTKLPGYEFVAKTLLQQLIIAIAQNTQKQSQNYSTSLKVEKIINYMHQKINEKVSLNELSDLVQLSPAYLSRAFKDITGYSIIVFFNKMKIDKAKELILEGDIKIKAVAQTLGFTDEFYFSRIFKRMTGISPSEFQSKNVHGV